MSTLEKRDGVTWVCLENGRSFSLKRRGWRRSYPRERADNE